VAGFSQNIYVSHFSFFPPMLHTHFSYLSQMLCNISNCHCYENKKLKHNTAQHLGFAVQALDEVQKISLAGCGWNWVTVGLFSEI